MPGAILFTLGGPIRKDKTFFFGAYQGAIQRNGQSALGFRTALLPPLTNERSAAALERLFGGQRGLFGGVAIAPDGSNINPVALKLLNFKFANGQFAVPTPQLILPNGLGQFSFSSPVRYREDQATGNLDHVFSERNQFSGRFFYARAPQESPFSQSNVPGWGQSLTSKNLMVVLSDTHTFTSKLINVARLGYLRFRGEQGDTEPINNSDLGITSPIGFPGMPAIQVSGLFTLGPGTYLTETTNTFIAQDTVSIFLGKHSLRLGVDAKRHQKNQYFSLQRRGALVFLSFADFLLGQSGTQNGSGISNVFASVVLTGLLDKAERYTDLSGFVQDDIKVSPRLTVNLGLRYDFFGPPSDLEGRLASFNPNFADREPPAAGTLTGIVLASNYRGPLPAGVTQSKGSGLWEKDYNDFAPRVGFALRLSDRPGLALRGGYGIYYQRLSGGMALQTITSVPFAFFEVRQGDANAGRLG